MLPPEAETATQEPLPPEVPPATAAISPHGRRFYQFAFTGDAMEYFRIWIVNLFLSVITIGLYSPWAKVRKNRYIYANTWVGDANLDYHGNPVAILKGRLIAVAALMVYNFGSHYVPKVGTAILALLMVAAPWLVVRSMQFNANNTSYRNLRFHFHGRYGEGLKVIAPLLLWPILILVLPTVDPLNPPTTTWGIAALFIPTLPIIIFYPYVIGKLRRFQVERLAYGTESFGIDVKVRRFYETYILSGFIFLGGLIVVALAGAVTAVIGTAGVFLMLGAYLLTAAIAFAYTRARITNLVFNAAWVGQVRFASDISAVKLGWIYFVNMFAIVLSCGLAVPWAVMRVARYRASCQHMECDGDLESFLADVTKPVAATGDQLGEFFDVDLSL
jgi:uncharacterized membrane protein YjgN (DUF898 family)